MGTGRATPNPEDDCRRCHRHGFSRWSCRRYATLCWAGGTARRGSPRCRRIPRCTTEHGAIEGARALAAILPSAIARVEAIHGRRFAYPVTIGVYVSPEAFVAANGLGMPGVVGTTFLGNVMLSPVLFSTQRLRLPVILTHELSHAHLRSWISELAYLRLPNWFKEGLAVMASQGGGAEGVSELQARDAIRRKHRTPHCGSKWPTSRPDSLSPSSMIRIRPASNA
jgi:hypothetical protein